VACPRAVSFIFGVGEVDVVHGEVVPFPRSHFAGELADDPPPFSLRHLEFAGPETAAERHLDLIFSRPPFELVGRTSHHESPGGAPAEFDAADFALVSGLRSGKTARCHSGAPGLVSQCERLGSVLRAQSILRGDTLPGEKAQNCGSDDTS
jgi:hypothetical protein